MVQVPLLSYWPAGQVITVQPVAPIPEVVSGGQVVQAIAPLVLL